VEIDMSTQPFHITDSNFEQTIKDNPVALVDFWATWCGPCRALAPIIEEIAAEYNGRVLVGKLDVDESPQTAENFNVYSIPTMIVFKDGVEVDRLVGLCPKPHITEALTKHL